ncbi:MAG: hypothetical protein ACREUL_09065 [Steroidobacteraceae bacterium]
MSMKLIRYRQLLPLMAEHVGEPDRPSISSVRNCESALTAFVLERKLSLEERVGDTLREGFNLALEAHLAALREAGRKPTYVDNRAWALRHWHRLVQALDDAGASINGEPRKLTLGLRAIFADGTRRLKPTAKAAGMSVDTLKRLLDGHLPRPGSEHKLCNLERVCDLDPDELIGLLPYRPLRRKDRPKELFDEYSELLSEVTRDAYLLKHRDEEPSTEQNEPTSVAVPPGVQEEWRDLLSYKTGRKDKGATTGSSLANGQASRKRLTEVAAEAETNESCGRRWRLRPPVPGEYDPSNKRHQRWAKVQAIDGQICMTAHFNWNFVSSFLGWALLPEERGGPGFRREGLTLALFADASLVAQFLDWKVDRVGGGYNNFALGFTRFALMLLNEKNGWLPKRAHLSTRIEIPSTDWVKHCCLAHGRVLALKREIQPQLRKLRDPTARIRTVLDRDMPMSALVEAANRMYDRRPGTGGLDEAIWARNHLLWTMLMSNPLRALNMSQLTWRADNTGELRKVKGEWRIKMDKGRFKNIAGAAKDRDYDQSIDPAVADSIDEYLTVHRPQFKTNTDLVFVSHELPNRVWTSMGRCIANLMALYVNDCPGSGPHAFRHIVGSSIVIKHHGNVRIAATILHDEEETVRANYVHLLAGFADRERAESISSTLKGLKGRSDSRSTTPIVP